MNNLGYDNDILDRLSEPFPENIKKTDNSRGFNLTSTPNAYIIERLNQCFGIGGWSYEYTPFETIEDEVCTEVTLVVYALGHENIMRKRLVKNAGGHKIIKGNVTDARKSAITDGLSKCASFLGIASEDFKGLSNGKTSKKGKTKAHVGVAIEPCPNCGKTESVIIGKPEYGGGFVCYKKKEGCGKKWGQETEDKPDKTKAAMQKEYKRLLAEAFGTPGPANNADGSTSEKSAAIYAKWVDEIKEATEGRVANAREMNADELSIGIQRINEIISKKREEEQLPF